MYYMKKTLSSKIFDIFNVLLMIIIAFACLAPILHVLFASVSDPIRLAAHEGIIIKPLGFTWKGYQIVFSNSSILRGYLNTIFYVVVGVSLSTFLTVLGGYALSRKNLYWGNAIMFFITFTMFFNGGLIPFYMVVRALGMTNTRWAIIIPTAISVFNLIIMRTSLREIPDSLEESAKIDGAGHWTIMLRIVLPLAKATIAVIVLFYAVGQWNSWFNATIFLSNRKLYPLQVILKEILVQNDTSTVMTTSSEASSNTDIFKPLVKYCTIVAATLPVLCFYPFAQKHFVTGVMIGSIKG
jgi:putative aldouronate transport system permease protein